MKTLLIKFRWIIYLLILALFTAGLFQWAKMDQVYQTNLLKELQENDLSVSEIPDERLKSVPVVFHSLFNQKITAEIFDFDFLSSENPSAINYELVSQFAELKGVSSVELHFSREADLEVREELKELLLESVKGFSDLKELSVDGYSLKPHLLDKINKLGKLESLTIDIKGLEPDFLKRLPSLDLKKLEIKSDIRFSEENLAELANYPRLEELHVGSYGDFCGTGFDRNNPVLEKLPPLKRLEKLSAAGDFSKLSLKISSFESCIIKYLFFY